jgi:quercetin dioxygenase-like cupin family protein
MNIQGKVWGKTQPLFLKNNVEIHRIEAKQGGYCSKHKHEHKYNAFFIEQGQLKITIWKNDYDLIDETIISDQQMSVVKPGEYHKFEALEDTIAYEIYWTELETDDIVRETCGGK